MFAAAVQSPATCRVERVAYDALEVEKGKPALFEFSGKSVVRACPPPTSRATLLSRRVGASVVFFAIPTVRTHERFGALKGVV